MGILENLRGQSNDDETLFEKINAYLLKVQQREKAALETLFRLKQLATILQSKPMTHDEASTLVRAQDFIKEHDCGPQN